MAIDRVPSDSGDDRKRARHSARNQNLAALYEEVLTGIVRLQASRKRLGDPDRFRNRMITLLHDLRQEAMGNGYSTEDVEDAEFASVAFLDEVILTSDDPGRQQWAKKPLAVDLYHESAAGESFFDRLDSLKSRRDAQTFADLLEVFLLCLLLGFEGRYTGSKGELHSIAERARRRITSIRQPDLALGFADANTPTPALATPRPSTAKKWWLPAAFAVAIAVVVYVAMKLDLAIAASQLLQRMQN